MTGLPGPPQRPRASPWPFAGMIGMACVFFLIAASVLTSPWYVVAALLVLWVGALVVAMSWWSSHPTWVPWLPAGVLVLWSASVVGGAFVLGWSG